MITEQEQEIERIANIQIKAMRDVFNQLFVETKVSKYVSSYYWFEYVDYAEVDRYGKIECYTYGYGNDQNTHAGYDLEIDDQLFKDLDVEAFKIRFRSKLLPAYNELRRNELELKIRQIKYLQHQIAELEGDIV